VQSPIDPSAIAVPVCTPDDFYALVLQLHDPANPDASALVRTARCNGATRTDARKSIDRRKNKRTSAIEDDPGTTPRFGSDVDVVHKAILDLFERGKWQGKPADELIRILHEAVKNDALDLVRTAKHRVALLKQEHERQTGDLGRRGRQAFVDDGESSELLEPDEARQTRAALGAPEAPDRSGELTEHLMDAGTALADKHPDAAKIVHLSLLGVTRAEIKRQLGHRSYATIDNVLRDARSFVGEWAEDVTNERRHPRDKSKSRVVRDGGPAPAPCIVYDRDGQPIATLAVDPDETRRRKSRTRTPITN
jgi:hypothetical protein